MSQNLQPLSQFVSFKSLPEELNFLTLAITPLLDRLKVSEYCFDPYKTRVIF
jgi:hypothetical protein